MKLSDFKKKAEKEVARFEKELEAADITAILREKQKQILLTLIGIREDSFGRIELRSESNPMRDKLVALAKEAAPAWAAQMFPTTPELGKNDLRDIERHYKDMLFRAVCDRLQQQVVQQANEIVQKFLQDQQDSDPA